MEPRNRFQGMNSASLCSLAGHDNPIPTRFLLWLDASFQHWNNRSLIGLSPGQAELIAKRSVSLTTRPQDSGPSFKLGLKVLSSEMDQAEIRLIR
jgi:hypothetical protein